MNDNKNPNDNVLALPAATPEPFKVAIPHDVAALVIIGLRPDGSLYFSTENDSLGDVSLLLDMAKAKVLELAAPPPDDGDDTAGPLAG